MSNDVVKALIKNEETGKEFEFQFNPTDFSLTRTIKWDKKQNDGSDLPEISFSGGETTDMVIQLLFDVSDDASKDVRDAEAYQGLLEMARINKSSKHPVTQSGEPPKCRFIWGGFLSFLAVITNVKQTFTMFRNNGTPIRAKVDVTFMQLEDEMRLDPQNPTSRTDPRKIWVVHAGQTLAWIAYEEYGNSAYWRHIAETNDLLNPKDLRPGQILKLTPLP